MRRFVVFSFALLFCCIFFLPQKAFAASDQQLLLYPTLFITPTPVASEEATPLSPFFFDDWENPLASDEGVLAQGDYCVDLPVILYHHTEPLEIATLLGHEKLTVDSTIFDEQMNYLVDHGYTTLSAEDFVKTLLARKPFPEKSIVVTIDDGYIDNYTYAFMAAKKYHVIINFMIPTGLIGKPDYMTWDHLKEMNGNPYTRIYNHTTTHAPLGLISESEIDSELAYSTAALRDNLGLQPTIFTYPYGSYNDLAIEKVKEYGFFGALSTIEGSHQCSSQVMTLQRRHIGNAPLSFYGF